MTAKDALPENTRFADTGCHVHPACLTCPLKHCIFDEDERAQGRPVVEGRITLALQLRAEQLPVRQIAKTIGTSERTVARYFRREKGLTA